MKTILYSLLFIALLAGCKDNASNQETDDSTVNSISFTGDYIHFDQMAVLSTNKEIYAVKINDKALELDKKADGFKKSAFDMVKVTVTGKLIPNPLKKANGDGWEEMLIIDKIVEVGEGDVKSVIPRPK